MEEQCKYLDGCAMFKRLALEPTKRFYIDRYCKRAPEKCVRKQKRDSGDPVPDNLMPNGETI